MGTANNLYWFLKATENNEFYSHTTLRCILSLGQLWK